jgi:hypothetical protein
MNGLASITIWVDTDAFKLYVKLNDRMENRDFHEHFLKPLKTLGFKFDPFKVAHAIDLASPQECGLLLRQLGYSFSVSDLQKKEILYWLGLEEKSGSRLYNGTKAQSDIVA